MGVSYYLQIPAQFAVLGASFTIFSLALPLCKQHVLEPPKREQDSRDHLRQSLLQRHSYLQRPSALQASSASFTFLMSPPAMTEKKNKKKYKFDCNVYKFRVAANKFSSRNFAWVLIGLLSFSQSLNSHTIQWDNAAVDGLSKWSHQHCQQPQKAMKRWKWCLPSYVQPSRVVHFLMSPAYAMPSRQKRARAIIEVFMFGFGLSV